MSAPAVPAGRARGAAAQRAGAAAAATTPGNLRLAAFVPLALFGLANWVALVDPTGQGAAWGALFGAVGAGTVVLGLATVARPAVRTAGLAAVVLASLVIAFRLAGVPPRLLVPDAWDDLAAGLTQGIGALPGITVPYRGVDEWIRVAILLGGTLLTALAALLAFWPARGTVAARPGGRLSLAASPLPAAVALTVLYAVPVVERTPQTPFLGGAVFCMLLGAFLWLERLRPDQVGVAALCLSLATAAGVVVAPRLDASRPWLDYQSLAADLEQKATSTFSWDHGYGAMTWPRDGREVLRVRAQAQSYWKATTLDRFDGVRWRQGQLGWTVGADSEFSRSHPQWYQTVRVVVRGMRTRQFIGAGTTLAILPPAPDALRELPGTFVVASGGTLKRGSSYQARVYTPKPTESDMRAAGTAYPDLARAYLKVELPQSVVREPIIDPGAIVQRGEMVATVRFPAWREGGFTRATYPSSYDDARGRRLVRHSVYARMYALANRLKAQSSSPYDFALRVEERLQRGATYSETPAPHRFPLESFVFDDPVGYCQQFSGAMALMLRMGGVPARVASGFTPGRYDRKRNEYVVRDLDAHSWVEVYFPGIGWATFDPTPAAAPARRDSDAAIAAGAPDLGGGSGGDRVSDPGAHGGAGGGGGVPLPLLLAGLLLLGSASAATLARVRRTRLREAVDPDIAELHTALRRSGRLPAPAVTLHRLERTLAGGSPAARDYLRALGAARYAARGGGPTSHQRRALRRELAAGLGLRGRLRALWALPPRRPRRARPS
ncbi:MAG TPA: transglutaminaseTgpA domain-containing protein [Solirubrobacteraceae bacterium]|nr:transglutaminaseTgpA domain-containing protein [Solirubrobacteraceae bacterium]